MLVKQIRKLVQRTTSSSDSPAELMTIQAKFHGNRYNKKSCYNNINKIANCIGKKSEEKLWMKTKKHILKSLIQ